MAASVFRLVLLIEIVYQWRCFLEKLITLKKAATVVCLLQNSMGEINNYVIVGFRCFLIQYFMTPYILHYNYGKNEKMWKNLSCYNSQKMQSLRFPLWRIRKIGTLKSLIKLWIDLTNIFLVNHSSILTFHGAGSPVGKKNFRLKVFWKIRLKLPTTKNNFKKTNVPTSRLTKKRTPTFSAGGELSCQTFIITWISEIQKSRNSPLNEK